MHTDYSKHKSNFDKQVFSYMMKRIFEDYDKTDAYSKDVIDGIGNVLKAPSNGEEWAYSDLDQFINMLKQNLSTDALRKLYKEESYINDIDPLFIIRNEKTDYSKFKDGLTKIVSKVQDKSYLPEHLYHDDSAYIEDDDDLSFSEQVSKSLTIVTYLLYTLRQDRNLVDVDFPEIKESVESTFNIRPYGKYTLIRDYCKENGLVDSYKITDEGIRLIVTVAKEIVKCNILGSNKELTHNHRLNWMKLSKA